MENKKEEKKELRYSQTCIEHRKKLLMPELTKEIRELDCDCGRSCYQEGCPIFVKPEPKAKVTKDNSLGINLDVFEEIGDDKPKKKKKFYTEKAVQEFLYLQERVLQKLAWHPEIYEALDNLSSQDILDRLLGKTGLEGVATHVGGDMTLKASPTTKKLFESLEKQFAEEDEKKGKGAPPNYETVGQLPIDTGFKMTLFDNKKEEKKDGKKTNKK